MYKNGQFYNNFQLKNNEIVSEIHSDAKIFEHKSGARLLVLSNDDDNKVFCATFKTPQENDFGVAHIMEHSVLCGSRKFPCKEPFVELMKSSLNTFLNAMTFSDKTMYPVASRNEQDFRNLIDVYMDSVFFPNITKETFYQEGWHHEVNDDGNLIYKGVVYNEMQGVYSSPESSLDLAINRAMFPDSIYGFESGGLPKAIPGLTYEYYKEFHETYYHPANCTIILYGDFDLEYQLKFLDEDYLSHFQKKKVHFDIAKQPRFSQPVRNKSCYSIGEDDSTEKKTFVSVDFLVGDVTDPEHVISWQMIDYILTGTSASLLKKALIDSGLGENTISSGFDSYSLETTFGTGLKGTEAKHVKDIEKIIFDTLKKACKDGIPKKLVQAALNTIEFQYREANYGGYPKGIVYAINVMTSWLYDGDILSHIRYEKVLQKIKEKIAEGAYFEELIEKYLLKNPHYSVMTCSPDKKIMKETRLKIEKELADEKEKMSEQELADLKVMNEELQKSQITPDSQEAVDSIPTLAITDVKKEGDSIPIEVIQKSAPTVLYHDLPTNGVLYLQLSLDASSVPQDLIQYMKLFATLYMKMGTEKYSYGELSQEIGCHTGGISFSFGMNAKMNKPSEIERRYCFDGKVMTDKCADLLLILNELLENVKFTDEKRLFELLQMVKASSQSAMINGGESAARIHLNSHLSEIGVASEKIHGLSYLKFIEDLVENFETKKDEIISKMSEIRQYVFAKENLLINFTAEKKDFSLLTKITESITQNLTFTKTPSQKWNFKFTKMNEGLASSGNVQYVAKGMNLADDTSYWHGSFDLLQSILRTGYLWDNVRVKGGAYGCFIAMDKFSGNFSLISYRDPNLDETIDIYNKTANYIEALDLDEKELIKLKIGTFGKIDSPNTAQDKGRISMGRYLAGLTEDFLNERRKELLNCTLEDVKKFSKIFQKIADDGLICVHGNSEKLKESKNTFDKITSVQS